MLRLNMAVPATPRNDPKFSSLGLVQAPLSQSLVEAAGARFVRAVQQRRRAMHVASADLARGRLCLAEDAKAACKKLD